MTSDEAVVGFVREVVGPATGAAARCRLFLAVRNLAYATDAASDAVGLVRQERGNCLAKADLLREGFRILGYEVRRVRWRYELPPRPPEVALLPSRYDIHTAVEIWIDRQWALVDGTHDPPLARGGLVVAEWDGFGSTQPNYAPIGSVWREGVDDMAIATAITEIGELDRDSGDLTESYLRAFNAWLDGLRDNRGS
jgi:transglutaminase-like putative cysteine protease